ncbi:phosphatidate cytidylyltransferase [Thermophagus sp. OGC60D27]|uniref:phosphatidate cytidylyltransferase n=1 Tax=Thermophagus sp. OGC60D27 TaxID=3458415 RepID=UPI004037E944
MNNFWQRTITGFLFVVAIILGLWWNPLAYMSIFAVVILLGMHEFMRMMQGMDVKVRYFWSQTIGIFLYVGSFLFFYSHIQARWLVIIVPLAGGAFLSELYFKNKNSLLNIATTLITPLYVALPFAFLHHLAFYGGEYNPKLLLGFFLLVWANDSGAYIMGSLFGKHKLFPSVSPAKSWEGAIGGIFFTILISIGCFYYFGILSVIDWIVVAGLVGVLGTYGDLIESMLKRSVNIKDSGRVFPGHGGILDRFDGVFFSAPVVSCYLLFC